VSWQGIWRHIVHWIYGGETKLINLILLCSHHFRLVHEGGYRIESLGAHVSVFYDRAGRVVPEAPPPARAVGPPLVTRNNASGTTITPQSCRSLGEGEHYDLGMTIDVLVAGPRSGGSGSMVGGTPAEQGLGPRWLSASLSTPTRPSSFATVSRELRNGAERPITLTSSPWAGHLMDLLIDRWQRRNDA
jgi:hypothetical protein